MYGSSLLWIPGNQNQVLKLGGRHLNRLTSCSQRPCLKLSQHLLAPFFQPVGFCQVSPLSPKAPTIVPSLC